MNECSQGICKIWAAAAALLLFVPAASHGQEDFADAARQYREGRWSGAYGRLIAAGRRGDAAAADAALFMHRFGPLLYRTQWDLSTDEHEDLLRAARPLAGQETPARAAIGLKRSKPSTATAP